MLERYVYENTCKHVLISVQMYRILVYSLLNYWFAEYESTLAYVCYIHMWGRICQHLLLFIFEYSSKGGCGAGLI